MVDERGGPMAANDPAGMVTPEPRPITLTISIRVEALVWPDPDGGYSAEVPALPGCITEGETLEEIETNLVEAAEGWLGAKAAMGPRS